MILTASINPDPVFVSLCSKMAPMASMGLFLAPMGTMRQVVMHKSVGSLPLLPHTTMISNAFLWITYGTLCLSLTIVKCSQTDSDTTQHFLSSMQARSNMNLPYGLLMESESYSAYSTLCNLYNTHQKSHPHYRVQQTCTFRRVSRRY